MGVSFICTCKHLFRDRVQLFWNLLFPILLGTMFYIAFSGLSSDEAFHVIPVAVVLENENNASTFKDTIDTLSEPGKDQLLDTVYVSGKEALALLEKKKVIGILQEGNPITLSISAEMSGSKLEQSILSSFVTQYNLNYSAIENIAATHPEKLEAAVHTLSAATAYNTETAFTDGTLDEMLVYFFNLIALSCLYSYIGGMKVATYNQANLSALGARKCIAPVNKLVSLISELLAAFLYQFFCIFVCLSYLALVLKINFGDNTAYILLTALVGCITGVSMGFFVGSIGKMSFGVKNGILMAVSMLCCFFSGLMVGNMRILVEEFCPWLNRINPAALIADSFYSLTVYQSHERYFLNLGSLLFISALFYFGGFLIVRRRKYAAL